MTLRKAVAALLVACFFFSPIPGAASTTDIEGLKRKVDLLGAGAQVKLKLSGGQKLRGQLAAIEPDAVLFAPSRTGEPRRIAFAELSQIQPAKKDYRAKDTPDPSEARRAVVGLGVGHHVMVRLPGDKVLRGHIAEIEPDEFTLRPDGQADTVLIEYGDVLHVRKNPSTGTIIAIAAGTAAATILIIMWAIREHNE